MRAINLNTNNTATSHAFPLMSVLGQQLSKRDVAVPFNTKMEQNNEIKKLCIICGVNNRAKDRKICETCKSRIQRSKNPINSYYRNLKTSAKRRYIEFNVSFEDFEKFCIKNNLMELRGRHKGGYSVDRIKSELGYTIDNMQILKFELNCSKGNRDFLEENEINEECPF